MLARCVVQRGCLSQARGSPSRRGLVVAASRACVKEYCGLPQWWWAMLCEFKCGGGGRREGRANMSPTRPASWGPCGGCRRSKWGLKSPPDPLPLGGPCLHRQENWALLPVELAAPVRRTLLGSAAVLISDLAGTLHSPHSPLTSRILALGIKNICPQ